MSPLASIAAGALALAILSPISAGAQRARTVLDSARPPGTVAVRGEITGADIVRAARRYLGVRYVLGGTTPRAFDCSGFTRYVYAQYGIALPRTARQQAGVGVAPFPGDLRAGDLLFFWGGQGAQHIAIYVGGDTIIHASSGGRRVKLDVLSGPRTRQTWFRRRLIAVRRVLPAQGVFYLPAATASREPLPGEASAPPLALVF